MIMWPETPHWWERGQTKTARLVQTARKGIIPAIIIISTQGEEKSILAWQNINPWGGWATTAREHTGFHFWQPRTEIWNCLYSGTGSPKLDRERWSFVQCLWFMIYNNLKLWCVMHHLRYFSPHCRCKRWLSDLLQTSYLSHQQDVVVFFASFCVKH